MFWLCMGGGEWKKGLHVPPALSINVFARPTYRTARRETTRPGFQTSEESQFILHQNCLERYSKTIKGLHYAALSR